MSLFHFGSKKDKEPEEEKNVSGEETADVSEEKSAPEDADQNENEALEDAILYYKWDNSKENLEGMLSALRTASLLVPAKNLGRDPTQTNEKVVRLAPQFVKAKNGQIMLPCYTSKTQLPPDNPFQIVRMSFKQICTLAARDPANPRGVVVNPFSDNILLAAAVAQSVAGVQPQRTEPGAYDVSHGRNGTPAPEQQPGAYDVSHGRNGSAAPPKAVLYNIEDEKVPDELKESVCAFSTVHDEIKRVWIRGLRQNDRNILLLMVETDDADPKPLFQELANELRKVYTQPLGIAAASPQAIERLRSQPTVYPVPETAGGEA